MLEEIQKELDKIFTRTEQKIVTINDILIKGDARIEDNFVKFKDGKNNSIDVKTIYSNGVSISIGYYPSKNSLFPIHCHKNIREYLICLKGSFGITFGRGYCILKYKECSSIPENEIHSVNALEDNSELLAICIPQEEGYVRGLECPEK